jgi:WD40 repeat protein
MNILNHLNSILANIYPTESSARRIAEASRLNASSIDFSGASKDRWAAILKEAKHQQLILTLLDTVLGKDEYPNNPDLQQIHAYLSMNPNSVTMGSDKGLSAKPTGSPTTRPLHHYLSPKPNVRDTLVGRQRQNFAGEEPIVHFVGRREDLYHLKQSVLDQGCRVIGILGPAGIGKTSLVLQFAKRQEITSEFQFIFWRSLRIERSCSEILREYILFLSEQQPADLPEDEYSLLELLRREYLTKYRCLFILDNIETILKQGSTDYRKEYEGFGEIIRTFGSTNHQSSFIFTSRERPPNLKQLARSPKTKKYAKAYHLGSMPFDEAKELLENFELTASEQELQALVGRCSGNPQIMEIVAADILDRYAGAVSSFLRQEKRVVFGEVRDIMKEQFERLSLREQEVMYWLAVERESASEAELLNVLVDPDWQKYLSETITSLRGRSLIETSQDDNDKERFFLQNAVLEYVTDKLIELVVNEVIEGTIFGSTGEARLHLFNLVPLVKAQSKDYVRRNQHNSILSPIIERLIARLGEHGSQNQVRSLLTFLKTNHSGKPGYAAGNILNLLITMRVDLSNYDFSDLAIWQTDLRGIDLPNVNFAHVEFRDCNFTEAFGSVFSAAISPDGVLVAAGTINGDIHVWRIEGLQQEFILTGHTDWVKSVTFSPDGKFIASGSDDQTARIWDVITGKCIHILRGHTHWINTVAFSPDSHLLATASEDKNIQLWDVKTGKPFSTLTGHTAQVWSAAFSPDGETILSGSADCSVRLWDVRTNQELAHFDEHTGTVFSVAYSPDGTLAASGSGSEDNTVRLWNVNTGIEIAVIQGHAPIMSIAFSPDGTLIASGSYDETIRIWDVSTRQPLQILQDASAQVRSVTFTPDGTMIVSGNTSDRIHFWDIEKAQIVKTLRGHLNRIRSIAFSSDGRVIASGGSDRKIHLWDVDNRLRFRTLPGHRGWIRTIAFLDTNLISGGQDRTIRIWDIATATCLNVLKNHAGWVRAVSSHPNRQTFASCSVDQTIVIWDARSGAVVNEIPVEDHSIWSISFNHDGRFLASTSDDHAIRIWDAISGDCYLVIHGHIGRVWAVAFDLFGRFLVSGSSDKTVRVWNLNGEELRAMSGHTALIRVVAINADGSRIASGGEDHTVRVWDVQTGECLHVLTGHEDWISSLMFSPNGMLLASGSADGTIRLWNPDTGECLDNLRSNRPYDGLNIIGTQGLSIAQRANLRVLGAVEEKNT